MVKTHKPGIHIKINLTTYLYVSHQMFPSHFCSFEFPDAVSGWCVRNKTKFASKVVVAIVLNIDTPFYLCNTIYVFTSLGNCNVKLGLPYYCFLQRNPATEKECYSK
jgi:hypothetical protein